MYLNILGIIYFIHACIYDSRKDFIHFISFHSDALLIEYYYGGDHFTSNFNAVPNRGS